MTFRRTGPGRSGITLTEILISIMILGVGLVSLATLFPLGLLRLREANRLARSGYLSESASADLGTRNLLSKQSFLSLSPTTAPWYYLPTNPPLPYDPWIQDTPAYLGDAFSSPYGVYAGWGSFPNPLVQAPVGFIPGPGLPVAYDPLWRLQTGLYVSSSTPEARFASGLGFIRPDPNPGRFPSPSAHGLQRVTNFDPTLPSVNAVRDIFVSPEDIVLQSDKDASQGTTNLSPVVPDLSLSLSAGGMPAPQYDWRYTWMLTGQQADATDGSIFDVDIVIFENRPFQLESIAATPFATSPAVTSVVAGETVVEGIFGFSSNVATGNTLGYGSNASRAVLLRWPATMPDPEVKVGTWIADVTYERVWEEDHKRGDTDPISGGAPAFFPYQRCYWYQVAKRTPPAPGTPMTGDPSGVAYREMTVWTSTPLRAFTLMSKATGHPYHVNAALISPYVINVFSRTIYTR